jgi:hypothetical protein
LTIILQRMQAIWKHLQPFFAVIWHRQDCSLHRNSW